MGEDKEHDQSVNPLMGTEHPNDHLTTAPSGQTTTEHAQLERACDDEHEAAPVVDSESLPHGLLEVRRTSNDLSVLSNKPDTADASHISVNAETGERTPPFSDSHNLL
jgi:hypothetical protein